MDMDLCSLLRMVSAKNVPLYITAYRQMHKIEYHRKAKENDSDIRTSPYFCTDTTHNQFRKLVNVYAVMYNYNQ